MRKLFQKLNNSGATLVMVIVCMLFIGIVSVAVLALAMGNFGNTDTVTRSSENFYTTEAYTDSLKVYLQQVANQAAKDAYMAQLSGGVVEAEAFKTSFRTNFANAINGKSDDWFKDNIQANTKETLTGYDISMAYVREADFVDNFIEDGILKNVVVTYLEPGTNYTTTLSSDIEIFANATPLNGKDPDKKYGYDVDKYIFISDSNIDFGTGSEGMSNNNTATGNIFANGDILVKTPDSLTLNANNIIASNTVANKGDIVLKQGVLKLYGLGKQYIDVLKSGASGYVAESNDNGNVWCDNFDIENGKVQISTKVNMYLGDDLTLEGDGTEFEVVNGTEHGNNGGIIAYSTSPMAVDEDVANGTDITKATAHKNSGSIVINGKNAKLDLSLLNKLYLAGTAYTEVPNIAGAADPVYKYFAQGESLTYKSLQSIYLVDGSKLYYDEAGVKTYVGSNPMTLADFTKWKDGGFASDIAASAVPAGVNPVSDMRYTYKSVEYASGVSYVYVYWKFADAANAINYFNTVRSEDVVKQKLSALGNSGYIKLPTNYSAKGNVIGYEGSTSTLSINPGGATGLSAIASSECASAKMYYNNIKTSLSTDYSMATFGDTSFDIFDKVLFAGNKLGAIDSLTYESGKNYKIYDLAAPVYDANSGCVMINASTGNAEKDQQYTYKLIVCKGNLDLTSFDFSSATQKYVIISKGSVTFKDAADFKGIVFAKGGVVVGGSNNKFTCLGNYQYLSDGNKEYTTEFEALLSVNEELMEENPGFYNDYKVDLGDGSYAYNLPDGNVLFRQIFGVSGDDDDDSESESEYDFTGSTTVYFRKS